MRQRTASRLTDVTAVLVLAIGLAAGGRLLLDLPAPAVALALAVLLLIVVPVGLRAPAGHQPHGLGAANRITLVRAVLVAGLAGLLPYPGLVADLGWWVPAVAALALALDGLDGWVARTRGTQTDFGARFDMELDALFILILCGLVWSLDRTGAWILLIGLMRYIFLAAGWLLPALRRPLPPSFRRRLICVLQVVALLFCLAPAVDAALAVPAAMLALTMLAGSFAMDVHWLLRHSLPTADPGEVR